MIQKPPQKPDNNPRQGGQPPQNKPPQSRWITIGWWVLMILLLAWNVWNFRPNNQPVANIPYSTLLNQVAAGNVQSVQIQGDQITGKFIQPIPSPEPSIPTPQGTPEQPAQSPAAPATTYTDFQATFPQAVGDPNFISLLRQHNVIVDVQPESTPWLLTIATTVLPFVFLIGLFVWMGRSAAQQQSGIFRFGRSKARKYAEDRPQATFNDVAGADEAKSDLQEVVDFLKHPKKYHDVGARIPRGVLLVGPPGTGKTLLARAVAGEAGVPFFSLSASEFV